MMADRSFSRLSAGTAPRRRGLRALAVATLVAACTGDAVEPRVEPTIRLAVVPVFATGATGIVDIGTVQARLTRVADGAVALDTSVAVAPDADSLELEMRVAVVSGDDRFLLTLAFLTPAGDTAFVGGPVEIRPTTGTEPVAIEINVVYVGTGADAVAVEITNAPATAVLDDTLQLTAQALDGSGEPIAGTPIGWRSLDTTRARVPEPAVGLVVTGPETGAARIVAELLTGPADTATLEVVVDLGAPIVRGEVRDAVTFEPVAGATIQYGPAGALPVGETVTNADGAYRIDGLSAGTFRLETSATGYVTNSAESVVVEERADEVVRADFGLPPDGAVQRFGTFSGRVFDDAGAPLAGATVSLSGGTQTNGVFRSVTAAADGTYGIAAVVLDDASGQPIQEFTAIVSASGFATSRRVVDLVENQTIANVDFALNPPSGESVIFEDDFESDTGWEVTGFWNRSTLDGIVNTAYPTYVQLAPDDDSEGALPAPVSGAFAHWYGQPETGNYLGTQIDGDAENSGGTSVESNTGTLRSPGFTLPGDATSLTLRFSTWFEIESVNPNESGFDLMVMLVEDVNTGAVTELGRLNPFVDPTLENRESIPFTSGGFNVAPVWRLAEADLSPFAGQTIRLLFTFDTVDNLFNGFRGWIVDVVRVVAGTTASPPGTIRVAPPTAPPSSRR